MSLACGRVDAAVLVSGQVVSVGSAAPVAGAAINVVQLDAAPGGDRVGNGVPAPVTAQTLANGSFLLKLPNPGSYTFKVDAPGFLLMERRVEAPPSGLSGLRLELARLPSLHLKLSSQGGEPVTSGDVQVWLLTASPHFYEDAAAMWATLHAPSNGMLDVPTSRNTIVTDAGGVGITVRVSGVGVGSVFLNDWPRAPVVLRLLPGRSLSGRVVTAAGMPLKRVQVTVSGADRDLAHRFLQGEVQ
ncbi:MAG: carboxypeptidase-like regulatory domain-containing protein, partial [Armatimonadota bacterium]|nr:carboxypeptidase-like regulatory domain-containing protein [Armatimonadota bacterium]